MRRPGRKDEAWRRTDLSSLYAAQLAPPVPPEDPAALDIDELGGGLDDESAGARLVLVNGAVSAELSDLSALPAGVTVCSLAQLEAEQQAAALAALAPLPEAGLAPNTALGAWEFAALNQAALADVACVRVAPRVRVDAPLHVLCVSTGAAAPPDDAPAAAPAAPATPAAPAAAPLLGVSHPNLLVDLGEGAQLAMLQVRDHGLHSTSASST